MIGVIPAEAAAWTGRPLTPNCSATAGFPSLWAVLGWCLTHSGCGTTPELSGQAACHPAGLRGSELRVPGGPRVTGMQDMLQDSHSKASQSHTPWELGTTSH